MISPSVPLPPPHLHMAFPVRSCGANDQIPMHTHEAMELVLVVAGHVHTRVAGVELDGPAGTLHVLPADVAHDQGCEAAWLTHCILFEGGERVIGGVPRSLDMSSDLQMQRWMEDICYLHPFQEYMGTQNALIGEGLLLALLGKISQIEHHNRMQQEMHPRLVQAVAYLHEHAAEDITLHMLADAACVSASHLSALFRQRFGCGPHQYQQRLRLEAARSLLHNPYLSVEDVARQCGYEDANYFSRLFRRVTGQQPSQWRSKSSVFARGSLSVQSEG